MNRPAIPDDLPEGDASIKRQVVLPFRKSLEISFKNIRVRFFRSMITIMSLILAVSFVAFVNVGNDIANGLLASGDRNSRRQVMAAGYDVGDEAHSVNDSPKQRWILILSLLVCVVGIINAQLMAVTERFREIGTMKCLGALNRFILQLFILEAGLQGLAGAAIGALIGFGAALLNAVFRFGLSVLGAVSWSDVMLSVLSATAIGCLLSLLGVLYPAIVAAGMQPVEAMRIEH